MNAAPLTTAQLEAMKKNVANWNARFPTPIVTPESKRETDKLKEAHFAALPHYVLD